MYITANDIIATATSISCLGIVLLYLQLRVVAKQFKADHERSRRENSIELLKHMDLNLKRQGSIARKFAETLDFSQSKCLLNQEEFKVDHKHKDLVLGSISSNSQLFSSTLAAESEILISAKDCSDIRWQVVSYLNNLETVLSAWRHNVADKAMIEEQYHFLVSPTEGHFLLKEFRDAAGGSAHFPAITEFVEHIQNKQNKKNKNGKNRIS